MRLANVHQYPDGAGVMEAVGPGVIKVKPGDRVYMAKTVTGAYAEYAIALESQVHILPAKVSFGQGAGVWGLTELPIMAYITQRKLGLRRRS